MSTDDFYASLPHLTHFLDLANPHFYTPAPDDWFVLITDVTGSTQAIETGHYKEVNLLGASSIIAVLNAIGSLEIPFVFGGDGASLLVPRSVLPQAQTALLATRKLAQEVFGMELRVGTVPVPVATAQYPIQVAKFRITDHLSLASFMGGGLTYATDLVKADSTYQLCTDYGLPQVNLSGLECRWQDIPSRYGQTVSVIILAMQSSGKSSEQVYRDAFQEIQHIYGTPQDYHPVAPTHLQLAFNPWQLRAELKAKVGDQPFWNQVSFLWKILLENLLGWCLMRFRVKAGGIDWGHYKETLIAATDYQKIDDLLRMVIAGTPQQTEQFTQYLDQQFRSGYLVYGIHVSDRALMTCLIMDRRDCHLHFIDGADGGYALAAKQFKARLRSKAQNWSTYVKLAQRKPR